MSYDFSLIISKFAHNLPESTNPISSKTVQRYQGESQKGNSNHSELGMYIVLKTLPP